jgi:predicted acylesterase/phospholipase RssA
MPDTRNDFPEGPLRRPAPRRALLLAGGGVIGGMYEVGVLAGLEEHLPGFRSSAFDIYIGSSGGSVVATLMAAGVSPRHLYQILDEGRDDPLNFQCDAVYCNGAFSSAVRNLGQLIWAVGKNLCTGWQFGWPDLLHRSESDMPSGFFSTEQLAGWMQRALANRGIADDFRALLPRTLLIPATDLDEGKRAVFGLGRLAEVPVSSAIAASCAIPGFFDPITLGGHDYVDGDVGYTGHADLAVERGATCLIVINPLVPLCQRVNGTASVRARGLYGIIEQTGRIKSQNLLELERRELRLRRPDVEFHLIQPSNDSTLLFGPSMGFEASRAALRFGYASTRERLDELGPAFLDQFKTGGSGAVSGSLPPERGKGKQRWKSLLKQDERSYARVS